MNRLTSDENEKVGKYLAEIKLIKAMRKGAKPEVDAELKAEINALVDEVNTLLFPDYKSAKLAWVN